MTSDNFSWMLFGALGGSMFVALYMTWLNARTFEKCINILTEESEWEDEPTFDRDRY